ncbi:unnamed protein product [Blepharisma stoltei]|uniref:Uncharacterized protein n=1 Tax=Blepharisma stoltei TaxID=1481888 RepID=A0AAU9J7A4_9CILI|nr:unnamed protein product [Blepharisma stoltei]
MVEDQNSLYPIALLIDELKSDDISRRINSVKNLPIIASALGYERTRNELIPYLSELLDDEELVLLPLAEILSEMVEYVGGRNFAHILFELLEQLSQVEDSSVRSAALKSFKIILGQIDTSKLEGLIIGVIRKMSDAEWISSKSGAAQLIPAAIRGMSPESQNIMLSNYRELLGNPNPSVRKSAAEGLKLLPILVHPSFENNLNEFLGLVATDKDDTVRILAVDDLLSFCCRATPAKVNSTYIPVLRMLLEDKSWRIRYLLCDKIAELCNILPAEHKVGLLLPSFVKFLQDNEGEVRTSACQRLWDFSKFLTVDEISNNILPVLAPLAIDVDYVKASFATNLTKLSSIIGKQNTNQYIMSLFLDLLRDPSPEIRICLFNDLEGLSNVIGAESLAQSVMPAIQELSDDKQWRIRKKIAECIPLLCKQLGQEFFETHLSGVMKKLYGDTVYSVREAAIKGYKEIADLFRTSWVEEKLLDEILEGHSSESHIKRLSTIFTLKAIIGNISPEKIISTIVPVLVRLSSDAVPNIRFNLAKLIKEISPILKDAGTRDQIKTSLRMLNKDEDRDVRFFTDQTLRTFG